MNDEIDEITIGTDNFFVNFINEWCQFAGEFNWYTFTFLELQFENEKMTGGAEFVFIVLGLGFRVRWNYKPEILEQMMDEAKEEIKKLHG